MVAAVLGVSAIAVGGYFAVGALRPDPVRRDESAGRSDPKPGEPAPVPVPAVTPPVVTPPEPARPLPASLGQLTATYRRELIRVNHPRNCVLCHAPSFQETDLVRGAVPDPSQPLPPPTTPAYYRMGGQFIAADTTYLKQDFSVVQPVPDPGNWSGHQRYDYFVAVRKAEGEPARGPSADSPYRRAVAFAIRELSGRDPDRDKDWLAEQRRAARLPGDTRLADVARAASLLADPGALLSLKAAEFARPLLRTPAEELPAGVKGLQEKHGATGARTALIAYLEPLTRTGDRDGRAKAARLLRVALGDSPDADLPAALGTAARADGAVPLPDPVAPAPPEDPDPAGPRPKAEARGLPVHSLAKRIDTRTAEELERELLGVREVSLDAGRPSAAELVTLADEKRRDRQAYPGAAIACRDRPDLAGLPFRVGLDSTLPREKAEALHALSKALRETVQACIVRPDDPRPDTDALHAALIPDAAPAGMVPGLFGLHDPKKWAAAEAVPCVQQILAAENREVRRLACELLRRIDTPDATETLTRWAVFETDAGNRAAAVEALRDRDRGEVLRLLVRLVRYPWPRAAEHAAEALVALNLKTAVPQLAALYDLPDPDAPFRVLIGTPAEAPRPPHPIPHPEPAPAAPPKAETGNPVLAAVVAATARFAGVAPKAARAAAAAELEAHVKRAAEPDAAVRRKAAAGLASFLRDPDELIRRRAAEALADLGADAEPASAALLEASKDPDADVRKHARRAMEKLGEAEAAQKAAKLREEIEAVAKDLKAKEPQKRIKALEKLAAYGAEANIAGEQLIEAMADPAPAVRDAASEALEKVNPKVHPHVFTLLRGMNKAAAVVELRRLKADAAIAVPLLLYLHDNPPTREVPAGKGGKGTTVQVTEQLGDVWRAVAEIAPKDKRFGAAVLASVAAPVPPSTNQPGSGYVNEKLRERRRVTIGYLSVIDASAADKVKALLAALGDGQEAVAVIEALGELGKDAEAALPQLKKLKLSSDDVVRNAATKAMAKIE